MKGIYILKIRISKNIKENIGKLGIVNFKKGIYYYIGSAQNNLEKRIKQHNGSKHGAHYTKIRRPVELKYSETFNNLKTARKREAEIKSWGREKKLKLISN